jgi:DNA-binding NtrC family response regulator
MKVILVDDEQKFINMLAKRLTLRGITADVAYTGEEAIQKVSATPYDLAVLDIKMPGISGCHLKNKLMLLDPRLKFIFVTGHGALDASDETYNEKDLYFSKPLNIEMLIKTIREIAASKDDH